MLSTQEYTDGQQIIAEVGPHTFTYPHHTDILGIKSAKSAHGENKYKVYTVLSSVILLSRERLQKASTLLSLVRSGSQSGDMHRWVFIFLI